MCSSDLAAGPVHVHPAPRARGPPIPFGPYAGAGHLRPHHRIGPYTGRVTDTATHAAIEMSTPIKPPGTAGTLADTATSGLPRPGSLPTRAEAAAAAKDRTLTSPTAVGLAHTALGQITEPLSVGEHVAARSEGERLVTHLFATLLPPGTDMRSAPTCATAHCFSRKT